jgi:hypothetical protein
VHHVAEGSSPSGSCALAQLQGGKHVSSSATPTNEMGQASEPGDTFCEPGPGEESLWIVSTPSDGYRAPRGSGALLGWRNTSYISTLSRRQAA